MRVLICGGGVIGVSIAYFLSCRGMTPVVIERTGLACAASGKSDGFLALDWCDGTPLAPLARRSFALHASLAQGMGGDWGYRRLTTYGGSAGFRRGGSAYAINWLSDRVALRQCLGSTATTAQIEPAAFTAAMMRAAEARGAAFRSGRVTAVVQAGNGKVAGVKVDGVFLAGDAVVIAMGPWSIFAGAWLPLPAIFGLKGHSLLFETGTRLSADALFVEYREASGAVQSPEIFPRRNGTTYVCAISSESPLPVDPAEVTPDSGAIERLAAMCGGLSPVFASAKVIASQACFRPVTRDGLPLIGRVPGVDGAYVATGHSVWGMLNAPATGEAIAELLADGAARHVDLSPFEPGRLPPLDPPRLRRNLRK